MNIRNLSFLIEKYQNLSIINVDALQAAISSYAKRTNKPEVAQWFNSVVKNYLRQSEADSMKLDSAEADKIPNLPDWAKISLEKGQDIYFFAISARTSETLNRIFDFLQSDDASNLLPKLQKIAVDQMFTFEREWLEKIAKEKTSDLESTHYKLIYAFSDGFKIVQLLTPKCKGEEGSLMGHCVGRGGYTKKTIFSLRDKQNQPHATMEIEGNKIVQLQGKQNSVVIEKYWPYIKEFISKTDYSIASEYLIKIGLIDVGDALYDINELPDNLTVDGDLDLYDTKITSLPDNLKVIGNLNLGWTEITSLPDNLTVNGNLYLRYALITSLPDNLTVGRDLYLYDTNITSLPDNLTVDGDIWASRYQLKTIPAKFKDKIAVA